MQKIKLLALDMDGTAYHRMGYVIEENIKPIQTALKQGVEVVFVTGRPVHSRPNQIIENGFAKDDQAIIIGYNGGAIYNIAQKKIIKKDPIKADLVRKAFALAEQPEFAGSILWAYVDDLQTVVTNVAQPSHVANKPNEYLDEMKFFDGNFAEWKEITPTFNNDCFKMIAFAARPGFIQALADLGFEVALDGRTTSEVNAPGINKAHALKWLLDQLKIDQAHTMAVGDGNNDIAMIKFVGCGVSIANSVEAVKSVAKLHIPLTNVEGAVAHIIEQYVLKK